MPGAPRYEQLTLLPVELALRKVPANCHVPFGGAYYSVPHALYGGTVIVRASGASVDILDSNGQAVASHSRCGGKRKYVTDPSHLPPFYYSVFAGDRCDAAKLRKWAKCFGECTFLVIDSMLGGRPFEEHAYRSCMAVLRLSKIYGAFVLERACRIALSAKALSLHDIQKIAKAEHGRLCK
jgi:hypothetical protein